MPPPVVCAHTHTHVTVGEACGMQLRVNYDLHAPLFHMPCVGEKFLIVCLPHIYPVLRQAGAANTRTTLCAVAPGKSEHFQPLKVQNGLNPQ